VSIKKDHALSVSSARPRWDTLAVLAAFGAVVSIHSDVAIAAAPSQFQVEEATIADIHAEGTHEYEPENGAEQLIPPVVEYGHGDGRCSITGGYVYRGAALSELAGTYVYGDYCSGEIFGLVDGAHTVLLDTGGKSISSFGEDAAGELYVVVHEGAIYRITAPGARS
jgi:hypothetical protein